MTHIANCMRADAEHSSSVYIPQETTMKLAPTKDANEPITPLEKSPSFVNFQLQAGASKFQLWPVPSSSSRSPLGLRPSQSSDKLSALSMGRSPTSLSDTAVPLEGVPFWRSGSLSRRRKVSVPELGNTMTTVQETSIDSPTIPGRPPLRKPSTESFGHERSSSAPGISWRAGPFGDALMSCVTGPSYMQSHQISLSGLVEVADDCILEAPTAFGKPPLSPILSPGMTNPKPTLKVDTGSIIEEFELPPRVPPKSPGFERKHSPAPLKLNSKSSKTQLVTPASVGTTPSSAFETRRSPNVNGPLPTPLSAISNPFSAGSPMSVAERRASPRVEKRDPMSSSTASHSRNISDTSVMERGRPVRRTSKRQRSRTCSETNTPEAPQDNWKLPTGMRVPEATMRMSESDKEVLHKQASDQADKFEVLNKRDVSTMSRELRALDERCDYLRKTYKSLRAGRQKLHSRMISYLKRGETVIFSRESLLKQEEALAELDVSIDEFILKLEQAENRRLRLRQKLLEHVAAALVLNPATHRATLAENTPPRSPVKADSPARIDRKDVESIKIYADGHVLNLFTDIEQAIGKMCEQAY
ncbi:Up-regulated during septation-domain-containing protein [Massariosphaeria phaeospora]|uniref:Up-regulated during septation-domain-containing protein n=1 Tax=Massariosphaeria phaeospora TaxID=100035 RepID=A0A7C8I0U2_9PLEO|nr:Up-regulated during septation-domain-containing protein [Massariosphaeria phaeospora]